MNKSVSISCLRVIIPEEGNSLPISISASFFMYPCQYYYPPYNPNAQAVTGIYREGELSMDMVIGVHR